MITSVAFILCIESYVLLFLPLPSATDVRPIGHVGCSLVYHRKKKFLDPMHTSNSLSIHLISCLNVFTEGADITSSGS